MFCNGHHQFSFCLASFVHCCWETKINFGFNWKMQFWHPASAVLGSNQALLVGQGIQKAGSKIGVSKEELFSLERAFTKDVSSYKQLNKYLIKQCLQKCMASVVRSLICGGAVCSDISCWARDLWEKKVVFWQWLLHKNSGITATSF